MSIGSRVLAAALCFAGLAGCDSVKDVRSEPSTQLPAQLVVLEGKVYGLGIRRSIVIRNGPSADAPQRLVQGFPGEPIGPRGRESRFSFGALQTGTSYNLVLPPELVPYGKRCVVNNGTGTLQYSAGDVFKGAPQDIEVVCSNDPDVPRHDIRVAVPEPFRSAPGAKVTLMTEEGIYEADPKDPSDGDPEYVWFRDALITLPAVGVLPFQNIVTATTEEGSTPGQKLVNRCAVTNHSWPSPIGTGADVTNVAVGACKFTVGGTTAGGAVRYSRPVGVTTDPAMGSGGLVLELKFPDGTPVPSPGGPTTEVTVTSFGSNFTFPTEVTSGASCPAPDPGVAPVPCVVRGFYEVAIKQQPAGQVCIVASSTVGLMGPLFPGNPNTPNTSSFSAHTNFAGSANLFVLDESIGTGTFPFNPADFTALRVFCRDKPAAERVLKGTYQMTNQDVFAAGVLSSSLGWSPAYAARREYSHILTLFDDGTFLFGAHQVGDTANSTSVTNHGEYGFYDYDPTNAGGGVTPGAKLRFTIHVDGNTGAAVAQLAAGLSSAEGPVYVDAALGTGTTCTFAAAPANDNTMRHQVMTNVVLGTVPGTDRRTISGRFGPDGAPTPRCATTAAREVSFVEPLNIAGQMTGNWITQDHMRSWTFSADTTVGYHVGMHGFANIQDNCFKMDDYAASSGQYVPSTGGSAVYCAPVGQVFNSLQGSVAHGPPPLLQNRLPGWRGWMPGGELGGGSTARSPSPVHFHIAPAAAFASGADPVVFPSGTAAATDWCATEILGVRATQNGELTEELQPIYFCRYTD